MPRPLLPKLTRFGRLGRRPFLGFPPKPGPFGQDKVATGASNGVATVAAGVVRVRAVTAAATGVATVTGTVVRIRARTAASVGTATVSASVVRLRARSASAAGVATVSGPLQVEHAIDTGRGGRVVWSSLWEQDIILQPARVRAGASVTARLSVENFERALQELLALELV